MRALTNAPMKPTTAQLTYASAAHLPDSALHTCSRAPQRRRVLECDASLRGRTRMYSSSGSTMAAAIDTLDR